MPRAKPSYKTDSAPVVVKLGSQSKPQKPPKRRPRLANSVANATPRVVKAPL